jgi:hypothetical protein
MQCIDIAILNFLVYFILGQGRGDSMDKMSVKQGYILYVIICKSENYKYCCIIIPVY